MTKHSIIMPTVGSIVIYEHSRQSMKNGDPVGIPYTTRSPAVVTDVFNNGAVSLHILDVKNRDAGRRAVSHRHCAFDEEERHYGMVINHNGITGTVKECWDWPATPEIIEIDDEPYDGR